MVNGLVDQADIIFFEPLAVAEDLAEPACAWHAAAGMQKMFAHSAQSNAHLKLLADVGAISQYNRLGRWIKCGVYKALV